MKTLYRYMAVVLLFILSTSAFFGGIHLITDPTGGTIRIPSSYIEDTAFGNYLIPGIILLIANGVLSLVIIILVIMKTAKYPYLIIIQGCVLIISITAELIININFFHPVLQIPCYLIGLLLIVIGYKITEY